MNNLLDHEWHEWKWEVVPKGFWNDDNNITRFLNYCEIKLGVNNIFIALLLLFYNLLV